jgi:tRNA(Arg) A34 adenosine deaminase TadA
MNPAFMRRAIELARSGMASGLGGPFGAVIVRGEEILGEACNEVTSAKDPTAHAEVGAIRRACLHAMSHVLAGAEIYSSCEPCPMCLSAIYWARLDRIYFAAGRGDAAAIGFDDAHIYTELALHPDQRQLRAEQALQDEAVSVMQAWNGIASDRRY